jgi:predicted nucleic acid-binding protein
MWAKSPVCLDTNVAIYAFSDADKKAAIANIVLGRADFVSVQLLNEFANAVRRKQGRPWTDVKAGLDRIRRAVPKIVPLDDATHAEGLQIAERYRLSVYDSMMLAVAVSGGARTFYTEDMQHGMTINETLRIVDPFIPGALDQ